MILQVEKLVTEGWGLCRSSLGVVFVSQVLPGEIVRVDALTRHRDYSTAEVVEIIQKSPHRVQPLCQHFGNCGGCQWQHIDYREQLRQKALISTEALQRQAGIDLQPAEIIAAAPWHYRSRFRFSRTAENRWGLKKRGSNEVVALSHCPIAAAPLENILQRQLPAGSSQQQYFASAYCEPQGYVGAYSAAERLQWQYKNEVLTYQPKLFFQSNLLLLPRLLAWLEIQLHATVADRGWDLFAGVGLFSKTLLKRCFRRVDAVEGNRAAAELLAENLAGSDVNIHHQPVEDFLCQQRRANTFAIMDPPRSGLSQRACQQLLRLQLAELCYISCNPVTWARDVQRLSAGYRLQHWAIFDFYPQSSNIEIAAVMSGT